MLSVIFDKHSGSQNLLVTKIKAQKVTFFTCCKYSKYTWIVYILQKINPLRFFFINSSSMGVIVITYYIVICMLFYERTKKYHVVILRLFQTRKFF